MPVLAPPQPQRTPSPSTSAPPVFTPARSLLLQRKCACGGTAGPGGECEECKKKKMLQRRSANTHSVSGVPPIIHDVLSSPGRPLDAGTRGFMEPRFGHDFGQVRVHDDARAAESAHAVDAHAYTVGQDIAFAAGRYDPHSQSGRQLLAHELAHTVQQRGLQRRSAGLALPSSVEDRRLESEAEAMAVSAIAGAGAPAAAHAVNRPVLSRAKAGVKKDVPGLKSLSLPTDADALDHEVYEVEEPFPLPPQKGPVRPTWDAIAKGGGLRSSLDLRKDPKVDVKQDRPELRAAWLGKVGWPEAEQDTRWSALAAPVLGKKPAPGKLVENFPRVKDVACHMDHIVELQVFGGNEKENIQVLDPGPNMSSGSQIRAYLSELSTRIKDTLGANAPQGVILIWRSVNQTHDECGDCCKIEKAAAQAAAAGKGETTSEGLDVNRHAVSFLGKPSEILVPKKEKKATILLAESDMVENRSVSRLIAGLALVNYNHKKPAISAVFDENARLPFELEKKKGKADQIKVAVGADGALTVQSGNTKQPIHYAKLSEGVIEHVRNEGGQLAGSGTITPSIPLLKPMGKLGFEFTPTSLKITKSLDPKKVKLPIPGVTITEPQLGLELFPKFAATGGLKFNAMAGKTPLLDGSLAFVGDDSGFRATGRINAHVPGVDKAEGDIAYSEGKWTGGVNVEAGQLKSKFKYVTAGSFAIGFSDAGIVAEGKVSLDLPHTENVEMGLKLGAKGWLLHGQGTLNAPRLSPIGLKISYDGKTLEGTASPGPAFKVFGVQGKLEWLKYKDGVVTAKGHAAVEKGRFKGRLDLELLPNQRFVGGGAGEFKVTDNLVASASVVLDKDEKLHFAGMLYVPKPIVIKELDFSGKTEFFHLDISFPVPGLSIATVGVNAGFHARLDADYKIGPANLRNIVIGASFDPLEENPNLSVDATGTFFMPASASIGGTIGVHAGLDALIAEVRVGLDLTARAGLFGNFSLPVVIHYDPKRWSVSADFKVEMSIALMLALIAFIEGSIGIWPFEYSARKDWKLAEKSFDTGLSFRAFAPLEYSSDGGFTAGRITFEPPKLDLENLVSRAVKTAPPPKES